MVCPRTASKYSEVSDDLMQKIVTGCTCERPWVDIKNVISTFSKWERVRGLVSIELNYVTRLADLCRAKHRLPHRSYSHEDLDRYARIKNGLNDYAVSFRRDMGCRPCWHGPPSMSARSVSRCPARFQPPALMMMCVKSTVSVREEGPSPR